MLNCMFFALICTDGEHVINAIVHTFFAIRVLVTHKLFASLITLSRSPRLSPSPTSWFLTCTANQICSFHRNCEQFLFCITISHIHSHFVYPLLFLSLAAKKFLLEMSFKRWRVYTSIQFLIVDISAKVWYMMGASSLQAMTATNKESTSGMY